MSTSSVEAMQYEEEEQTSPMQGSETEQIVEDDENMAKLKHVASTGSMSSLEWPELKSIVHARLIEILDGYVEQIKSELVRVQLETSNLPVTPLHTSSATDNNNSTIGESLIAESFIYEIKREEKNLSKIVHDMYEPPFTIQRICELLYDPARYYDKGDKFVRAIEKNLRVVSPYEEPKQQNLQQQEQQQQTQHLKQPQQLQVDEELPQQEQQPQKE